MLPLPPGRFSMMTPWPRIGPIAWATMRAGAEADHDADRPLGKGRAHDARRGDESGDACGETRERASRCRAHA
jgi:hypothetical protein